MLRLRTYAIGGCCIAAHIFMLFLFHLGLSLDFLLEFLGASRVRFDVLAFLLAAQAAQIRVCALF